VERDHNVLLEYWHPRLSHLCSFSPQTWKLSPSRQSRAWCNLDYMSVNKVIWFIV
jgi:hypothetical protein